VSCQVSNMHFSSLLSPRKRNHENNRVDHVVGLVKVSFCCTEHPIRLLLLILPYHTLPVLCHQLCTSCCLSSIVHFPVSVINRALLSCCINGTLAPSSNKVSLEASQLLQLDICNLFLSSWKMTIRWSNFS
jgi:hypothetical protein